MVSRVRTDLAHWLRLLLLLALATPALAQDVELTASVDRESVRLNESFNYVLRAEGSISDRPDLSVITRDFELLDQWQSSTTQIFGGRATQVREWVLALMPRTTGTFELPPVEVGGQLSNAVTVQVEAANPAEQAGGDIFFEVSLDRPEGYVQAQSIYSLKLYVGINTGRATLTQPLIDGGEAIVEKLGADREMRSQIDGRDYIVLERRYAIFPQEAGTLRIGPVVYESTLQSLRGLSRQQRISSDTVELVVKPAVPPPAEFAVANWLPARHLRLQESWSDDRLGFAQGIPQTRTLTVIADGLQETQLPELDIAAAAGMRQYSDQPELSRDVSADGITAIRRERYVVMPQEAGSVEIPAVELPWWNIDTERWEVARIDPRLIEVAPGAGSDEPADTAVATTEPDLAAAADWWWPWLSAALAVGWLATAAAWLLTARTGRRVRPRRQRTESQPSARGLLRQISAACKAGDAHRTRELVLAWGQRQFSEDPPRSLGSLASRLPEALAQEVSALEATLYGPAGSDWRGDKLETLLQQTRSVARDTGSDGAEPLVPLYR